MIEESKKVIKIFVSRRLDLPSVLVANPLYVPVNCGAIFGEGNPEGIVGDDTGNHISSKRNQFCELTVQYWAWKNEKADYYGLCHYRRYLTFASKRFHRKSSERHIMEFMLDDRAIRKYDLLNEARMRRIIESCDAVVNEASDVRTLQTPQGYSFSVYEHWASYDRVFLDKRVLPMLMDMIREECPVYYEAAKAYMSGFLYRGYNCYVLRRELFFEMCEFQFPILFAMEEKLYENGLSKDYERTLGYLGEIMYGIFMYYIEHDGRYRLREVPLVYFEQTVPPDSLWRRELQKCFFGMKANFESIGFALLPRGTKRRQFVKSLYMQLMK